ncbi:MAG TPA: acryloyl-CoA reductase [Acidimicrobiales bacterium]|nr:acryloyl-CoA reductase [Acidimicrobiales bacterium]
MTSIGDGFRAYVVRRHDEGLTQRVEEMHLDDLPPGDVLISVSWSGVNYKDAMVASPTGRVARATTLVPGVDLAGVVVSSTDPALAVGTEVLAHGHDIGVGRHGGFAAFARLPAEWVIRLPAGLSPRDAMILGTAGFTAALSLDELERHGLTAGDGPVLVTGASGGVGSIAVVLLASRGYDVVASTGKASERDRLLALGATSVVGRDALTEGSGRVLGPERWAGAVDCVGGTTLAQVLRSLRYGAAVAASGLTGGSTLETTVYPFITRHVALLGVDSVETDEERRRAVWARLGGELRPPDLDALVEREVQLDEVADALDEILGARARGRILVLPRS